ncbi:hypothetical protein [Mycobacteroides abscessus]|nr:hypothetical protein [Mycobacteroides abscessus]
MTWTADRDGDGTRVTVTATDVPPGIGGPTTWRGLRSSLHQLGEFAAG